MKSARYCANLTKPGSQMNKQDLQKHLLIVDDDQRIRALLEKFLREHHYLVDSAQNACQARQLAQTMIYDLLVIDIMMPGEENGLDFVTALRGGDLCAHRDTPVLLLTARGEIDDRLTGLSVGADDYLSKPFEPQELLVAHCGDFAPHQQAASAVESD